jgi:hypothetical protein
MADKLTILTSIHVLAAVLWVGGGATLNIAITMALRSRDPQYQLNVLASAEKIGQRLYIPLSLIVLGAGIWLTISYYDWELFWIQYGLGIVVFTSLLGSLYLGPTSGKVAGLIGEGASQDAVQARARPLKWIARADLLILFSVIVVMVMKPV